MPSPLRPFGLNRFSRGARRFGAGLVSALLASTLHAVAPNLTTVTPAGGQRGARVEVTLRGERLDDAQEILLYGSGIAAEKITEAADKQVKVTLVIAADCSFGEHAFRVRTATGISPLRLFFVGPFAAIEEKEPNNTPEKPQAVALNTTVHGALSNEDIDVFALELKEGQRFSAEIEGARLGRTMFDPILTLQGPGAKTIATSDDTPLLGHDGFISVIVPQTGRYLVQVRDMTYAPGNHVYRLHIGTFPRPALAVPLGGKTGETLAATLIGDAGGKIAQDTTLPAAPNARFGFLAEKDGLAPSPNWLRVSAFPNATGEAASSLAKAPLLAATAPFAFNGVLSKTGEADFFRFTAKKDQNLDFSVVARRLGSPLDSVLTVLDAKGKSLANNDDAAGHPDSSTRLKIPADGDYVVKIADQLGRGGPLFAYRVEITEVQPTITLSIPDTARYDNETRKSIVVPRGNRFAVLLNLNRDTCNDDLTVNFPGLPAGITARAEVVPGSVSAVPVVFEAADDAPLAGALLTPTAASTEPEKTKNLATRFRHTIDWVRIQNDTGYSRSEVDQIAAAVVEAAPFKIRIVEPKVPLVQSGEMNLQIVAERAEGFNEPITVKMLWNPPGVSSLPEMTIPKNASTVAYKLNTTNKADVRKWKTAVVAGATVKGGTAYVSSPLAELEIAPPFLAGKMELAKVERGQSTKMICALEQKVPFEGTAIARLVGLPDTVTAKEVEITAQSKTATFEIVTTDKSPVGLTKNIFCTVVITRDGEPITHVIAAGSVLRIDAPRAAKPATVADNKTE